MTTHVQVLEDYRGAPSQENLIEEGTYAIDDPKLFGCGHYLVANGFAISLSRGLAEGFSFPPKVAETPLEPKKTKRK